MSEEEQIKNEMKQLSKMLDGVKPEFKTLQPPPEEPELLDDTDIVVGYDEFGKRMVTRKLNRYKC